MPMGTDDMQLLDHDSAVSTPSTKAVPEGAAFDMMAVELSFARLIRHIFEFHVNVERRLQDVSASSLEVGDMLKSCQRKLDHWYNNLPSPLNQSNAHEYDILRGKIVAKQRASQHAWY